LIGTVVGSAVIGIAFWVLPAVWLVSCSQGAGHGRPETLNPILGHHGVGIPRTTPSEPVVDYAVDLGTLEPAWPDVDAELPRLIRAVIARGTWTDEHHSAIAMDRVLRVRHRPDVVPQVRRLVDDLRARLLRPLDIQVAFVEVKTGALDRVFKRDGKHPGGRWSAKAFRAAVGRGEARSLARVVLPTHNGRWALSDRVSNQVFLSGITITDGAITPQTTALASGFTIQAAAWRWGEEKAVCAVTGLYTAPAGEADGGQQSITQRVHRELPRRKATEFQWEAHEVTLQLPVRELLEFQNQLTVNRNAWTVAAVLPRDRARVNAVLVKVDWRSPPPRKVTVDPLSDKGYLLEVIPVALPTDTRPYLVDKKTEIDNRREIAANSVEWFKDRAKTYQQAQKSNTYNLQSKSGAFAPTQGWLYGRFSKGQQVAVQGDARTSTSGLMPRRIERLREQVMRAPWPEGTALEFVANHVFVVHERAMARKVRTLLEQTHGWRNRQVFLDAAFPVLDAGAADRLKGSTVKRGQARALRRRTALPGAFLLARGGAWAEIFVGEMHTVISKAWAPDRSSPPVHVYWRGSRLAAQPHLGVDQIPAPRGPGIQRTEIRWKQHRLERVTPRVVAGTILQQPVDSIWAHDGLVHLGPRSSVLVGLHGEEELRAVLLSSSVR
jgi:hypothetical protein